MRFHDRRRFRACRIRRSAARDLDRTRQLPARDSALRSLRTLAAQRSITERLRDPDLDAVLGSIADSDALVAGSALVAASDLVSGLGLASASVVGVGADRGASGDLDGVGIHGGRATHTRPIRTLLPILLINILSTQFTAARPHRGRVRLTFTATPVQRATINPCSRREIPTTQTRILLPATLRLRRQPSSFI
jgi:hypothetical protein